MASYRLIDQAPTPSAEAKKVQILFLGMSRTGTMSIKVALEKLGYKTYHMMEVFVNFKQGHFKYWHEAIRAKYQAQGSPYGPREFEKLFANYDAISDIPSILFIEELLETYPDAKVVLTNRDADRWLGSMERSFYSILSWQTWALLVLLDRPIMHHYIPILRFVLDQWTHGRWQDRSALRQGFRDHYAYVRKIVPPDRLLEFDVQKDGWAPLCRLLGKAVPKKNGEEEPFPKVNDGPSLLSLHSRLYWWRVGTVLAKISGIAGATFVAVGAVWWARRIN